MADQVGGKLDIGVLVFGLIGCFGQELAGKGREGGLSVADGSGVAVMYC